MSSGWLKMSQVFGNLAHFQLAELKMRRVLGHLEFFSKRLEKVPGVPGLGAFWGLLTNFQVASYLEFLSRQLEESSKWLATWKFVSSASWKCAKFPETCLISVRVLNVVFSTCRLYTKWRVYLNSKVDSECVELTNLYRSFDKYTYTYMYTYNCILRLEYSHCIVIDTFLTNFLTLFNTYSFLFLLSSTSAPCTA
jgi:hypothetical protein